METQKLQLEAGKYYRTRSGGKAFVAGVNPFSTPREFHQVVGFVEGSDGDEIAWRTDGRFWDANEDDIDLVAEWVEPKRIKGWVNVYGSGSELVSQIHPSQEAACKASLDCRTRIACIEIDVLEGQGLEAEAGR